MTVLLIYIYIIRIHFTDNRIRMKEKLTFRYFIITVLRARILRSYSHYPWPKQMRYRYVVIFGPPSIIYDLPQYA